MSDRSKPKIECSSCGMQKPLCFCPLVKKINLDTFVTVVMPWLEWNKTSNTGRLVGVCLENSRILIRGKKDCILDGSAVIQPDHANLVLFPGGEDLAAWREANGFQKVNLIVPDGTWESAVRVIAREPHLAGLKRVSVSSPVVLPPRLRKSGDKERLSTLEAVASAVSLLEGEGAAALLFDVLRMKQERVLWARGRLRTDEVSSGIPHEAIVWKTASRPDP